MANELPVHHTFCFDIVRENRSVATVSFRSTDRNTAWNCLAQANDLSRVWNITLRSVDGMPPSNFYAID